MLQHETLDQPGQQDHDADGHDDRNPRRYAQLLHKPDQGQGGE
jgi:hypothetical protein